MGEGWWGGGEEGGGYFCGKERGGFLLATRPRLQKDEIEGGSERGMRTGEGRRGLRERGKMTEEGRGCM